METHLPTWRDVDVPANLIAAIKKTDNFAFIGFLLSDRVFREENKISYSYFCVQCGKEKNSRQFEEYTLCESCLSNMVKGSPHWKSTKHSYTKTTNLDTNKIIRRMENNFGIYISKTNDIVSFCWENDFVCQFLSGERVKDCTPSLAIAKAAILCPFLWDTGFNWREGKKGRSNDLHYTHLISQWL
jgi:DNA-directed RNA polymerase subunit RPC12/RpoP